MQVLYTFNVLVQVEDEEEAHSRAIEFDKTARLGFLAALEKNEDYVNSDLTVADIEKFGRALPVQITILPELEKIDG
jgi:hypothetical protein